MSEQYMVPPQKMWVLIDIDNSSGDGVKNYMRFFLTRREAREYKEWQNSHPNYARLIGPYRYNLQ